MTEGELAKLYIRDRGWRRGIIIRNETLVTGWEADIFIVENGIGREIEVKVSASDLRKEFGRTYPKIEHVGLTVGDYGRISSKERKHDALLYGGPYQWERNKRDNLKCGGPFWIFIGRKPTPVSYYSVLVPEDLKDMAMELVPEGYGVISVRKGCTYCVRKTTRIVNSRKVEAADIEALARHLSSRYWTEQFGSTTGRK